MVEIRYGDQFEVSELAGQTVAEAREQFKAEFGIPNKAHAKLNGSKIKASVEADTVLTDDDKLTFAVSRGKGAYLVGALLLALAVTGGVFAYGWINTTTSLTVTLAESNFADVSANTSVSWGGWGFYKKAITGGPLFDVTPGTGWTGDLGITVTLGNADELSKVYKVLALQLEVVNDNAPTTPIYIDAGGNAVTWTMLTLDNGSATMFVTNSGVPQTVRVKSGFYITHAHGAAWASDGAPDLFCEVFQR